MLYYPFVISDDLLTVNGTEYGSFTDAFDIYPTSHTHPLDFYTDPL